MGKNKHAKKGNTAMTNQTNQDDAKQDLNGDAQASGQEAVDGPQNDTPSPRIGLEEVVNQANHSYVETVLMGQQPESAASVSSDETGANRVVLSDDQQTESVQDNAGQERSTAAQGVPTGAESADAIADSGSLPASADVLPGDTAGSSESAGEDSLSTLDTQSVRLIVNSAPQTVELGVRDSEFAPRGPQSTPFPFRQSMSPKNMSNDSPEPVFKSGVVTSGAIGQEAPEAFKQAIATERTDQPVDTRSAWQHKIDAIMQTGTNKRERYVVTQMEAYLADMAPNKEVDVSTGVLRQKQLWRVLKNVVSVEDGFSDAVHLMIEYFREHGQAGKSLHAIHLHRFIDVLDLSSDDMRGLAQLTNIFTTAAGVKNLKDVLKHCALRQVELKGVDEIVRERLYNFFDSK